MNEQALINKKRRSGETETTPIVRCAIYTRKSTDEGLDQEFNSLDVMLRVLLCA